MSAADRLRQLDQAATPGPWLPGPYEIFSEVADCPIIGDQIRPDRGDQELIFRVRNALPALADVVEAAQKRIFQGEDDIAQALTRLQAQLGQETP